MERPPRRNRRDEPREAPEYEEIVLKVKRCCKVVKGGKRFNFSALVTVGNKKGRVGYGHGKAKEVPFAVEKAIKAAKRNLVDIPIKDTTIPHRVEGKYGASRVIVRPACKGTGIIAGSAMRAILELAGVENVLAKVMGSTNPMNVVRATVVALQKLKTKKAIEELRGVNAV
ncbi:MAG: 30S ribosomal protein S5 [Planctomycetes bacterium]|nr:30S ribosomal protein S5 [Planctomycetota bacterium]